MIPREESCTAAVINWRVVMLSGSLGESVMLWLNNVLYIIFLYGAVLEIERGLFQLQA